MEEEKPLIPSITFNSFNLGKFSYSFLQTTTMNGKKSPLNTSHYILGPFTATFERYYFALKTFSTSQLYK